MTVTINEVENGFIVEGPAPNTEGIVQYVFETNSEEGSKEYEEAFTQALYCVKELLGIYGSKHNKYRTTIEAVNQNDV